MLLTAVFVAILLIATFCFRKSTNGYQLASRGLNIRLGKILVYPDLQGRPLPLSARRHAVLLSCLDRDDKDANCAWLCCKRSGKL